VEFVYTPLSFKSSLTPRPHSAASQEEIRRGRKVRASSCQVSLRSSDRSNCEPILLQTLPLSCGPSPSAPCPCKQHASSPASFCPTTAIFHASLSRNPYPKSLKESAHAMLHSFRPSRIRSDDIGPTREQLFCHHRAGPEYGCCREFRNPCSSIHRQTSTRRHFSQRTATEAIRPVPKQKP
jgi:hypothetical protein